MINAAFITADIARSTEIFTSAEMERLAAEIREILAMEKCIYSFNRFDAFQILYRNVPSALELAMKIRMLVKKSNERRPDVRICLGLGYADTTINEFTFLKDPLFVKTGRAFDGMETGRQWFRIILSEPEEMPFHPGFTAIELFTDFLIRRLTQKQTEILYDLLSGYSQTEIATRQNKSLPTINIQVKALAWGSFRDLNRLFKESLQNIFSHAV